MLGPELGVRGGMASVQRLILDHAARGNDLIITHIATYREGPALVRCAVFVKGLVSLLRHLMRRNADVVHIHFASRGSTWRKLILTLAARIAGTPVVLHAHGGEFHQFYAGLPRLLQGFVTRLMQNGTFLLVLSDSWKRFYCEEIKFPDRRVMVLPNPVEIPAVAGNRDGKPNVTILFLGVISQRKGIFDLIWALSQISQELRERVRLLVAGDGDVERAKDLAKTLGVKDVIEFLGWIAPEDRDRLLRESDIFVLPSYAEGLPMALLEAMAWGLPVIATPVGGNPEIITDGMNGLFVEPGDIAGLRNAIETLAASPERRRELGSAARRTVLPLDVSLYVERLTMAYESAIRIQSGGVLGESNA